MRRTKTILVDMSNTYFIGIDPGKTGAVAIIYRDSYAAEDIPLMAGGDVNVNELSNMFVLYTPERRVFCLIEKAQPMPKQGVVSVFNYGKHYGELMAWLKIMMISFQEISPNKWKREFQLLGKDKKESVAVCQKLFPEAELKTPRGRLLHGRAEALLLAEYARRHF